VGRTADVWLGTGSSIEPFRELSGSSTFTVPVGATELPADSPVNLDTTLLWSTTDDTFAGSVDITYRVTGLFVPFGWAGSQALNSRVGS
jgi:hypothetical protein